jgi:hypothetical protein
MTDAAFSVIRGLVAVAISSGLVLTTLSLINRSGLLISLWLGFIAAVIVAVPLAALALASHLAPGVSSFMVLVSRNLVFSLLLWIAVAVVALFIANLITEPQRVADFGFWGKMGSLYGACGGLAYWLAAGTWWPLNASS